MMMAISRPNIYQIAVVSIKPRTLVGPALIISVCDSLAAAIAAQTSMSLLPLASFLGIARNDKPIAVEPGNYDGAMRFTIAWNRR
jgi:hypothetical protein